VAVGGVVVALCAVLTSLAGPIESQVADSEPQQANPGAPKVRLITQAQFAITIAEVFGPDIDIKIRFAPVPRSSGLLKVGSTKAGVSSSDAEQFHRSAYAIAAQVVDDTHRSSLIPCKPADPAAADAACARKFLARAGRLLFRRSSSADELKGWVSVAGDAGARTKNFYSGLSYALAGMLADPDFLFIVEHSEPNPAKPGAYRLTPYSLATRISLLLWNSAPDDALLKAAESGALFTAEGRARVVDAMVASPRFENGLRAFFSDMLAFENFTNLAKDPSYYPKFTQRSADDAEEQILRLLVDHIARSDRDYREIFTTRTTFISPDLAPLYGLASPTTGWTKIELPADDPRRGIVTQIGFLAVYSHPGRSSPTKRGRALRELLLCQKVPDPPPNVDFSNFEDPKNPLPTARERLHRHSADPTCAGCHKLTDPLGLALENFDGAGQFRDSDKGAAIDASGKLEAVSFQDAAGLGEALRTNPATTSCLVNRVFAYGTGRATTPKDRDLLTYFDGRFAASDYRVKALMRTIANSRAITEVVGPDATTPSTHLTAGVTDNGKSH
jgi:hypothetical protein